MPYAEAVTQGVLHVLLLLLIWQPVLYCRSEPRLLFSACHVVAVAADLMWGSALAPSVGRHAPLWANDQLLQLLLVVVVFVNLLCCCFSASARPPAAGTDQE